MEDDREKLIPIHVRILYVLKKNGGVARHKDLRENVKVSLSGLHSNLKLLLVLGYIAKQGNNYVLTQKGVEYLEQVRKLYREFVESL